MRDLVPASLRFSSHTWRRALVVVAAVRRTMAKLFLLGHSSDTMLLKGIQTANADNFFFDFAQ
jgi:hypothetical protein